MFESLKAVIAKDPTKAGQRAGVLIVALALGIGAFVWHLNMIHPRTNDAMVRANTIDIVIQHVSGRIATLAVKDNQFVHQGDLLYAIDARPYEAILQQAEAELHVAEMNVAGQMAAVRGAVAHIHEASHLLTARIADVAQLEAKAQYAGSYLKRIQPLEAEAFVTHNQVRQAEADWKAAEAAVRDAQAKVDAGREALEIATQARTTAEAQLAQQGNAYARIQAAEAKVRQAQLNVEYCTVKAPFDGWVTNLNTQLGQYVAEGQKIFALVDDTQWYVMADYKETYLRHIHPGDPVDVFLASYPGVHFKGEVQGIGWANYPDNVQVTDGLPTVQRTLNWVVLAARFPVRIRLLDRDPEHPFRMGMTAFTTVGIAPAH
jgi:membrane fusion protein, multidrug efflux system